MNPIPSSHALEHVRVVTQGLSNLCRKQVELLDTITYLTRIYEATPLDKRTTQEPPIRALLVEYNRLKQASEGVLREWNAQTSSII